MGHRLDDGVAVGVRQAQVGGDVALAEDDDAVGDFEGFVDVRGRDHDGGLRGQLADRLADVVPAEALDRLSFIKIDVEGMEAPVMRDIMTMLPDLPRELCLCAELRVDAELRPIMADLAARGFAALTLPNHYTTFAYPDHPTQARIAGDLPDGQVDIAFKRG